MEETQPIQQEVIPQKRKAGRPKGSWDRFPRSRRGNLFTPQKKAFARKIVEGKTPTQAAMEVYGYKDINNLAERKKAQILAERNLKDEKVLAYIHHEGYGAATRIVQLSKDADNETVKLNANKDILDRAQIGVRQGPAVAVQINFAEERERYS